MVTRFATLVLVIALVFGLTGKSALARTLSDTGTEANAAETSKESGVARKKAKQIDSLRSGVLKLVADAKTGKVAPTTRPQIQPAKSNGLSRGAKIAIGVGVAVIVIALIVKHQKDHLFDKFNLNGLGL